MYVIADNVGKESNGIREIQLKILSNVCTLMVVAVARICSESIINGSAEEKKTEQTEKYEEMTKWNRNKCSSELFFKLEIFFYIS